jgi:anti-sigma-K factor RskA
MATEACREWRGDIGVEALGALEAPQRTALLAHVDGCAGCRAALAELVPVANALDLTDVERVGEGDPPSPSSELGERILGRLQQERAVRRRRRTRGLVTSVVGIAAAIVVGLVLVIGTRSTSHGTVVALHSTEPGVHAQAVLYKDEAGTRVRLAVDGLDDGDWYWLWVTGANGKRVGAGTFAASRSRENVTMTAALAFSRTQRVWITDANDHVVLDGYLHGA